MRRSLLLFVPIFAILLTLPACESWSRQEKGMAIGAVGGAGLGGLIGAAAGSTGWGIAIGAVGGALAGYVIADVTDDDQGAPPPQSEAVSRYEEAKEYLRRAQTARTHEDSKYYLNKSLDAYPTADAYNNLGIIYLQEGRREEARTMFRKALDLDPGHMAALKNLERMDQARG